MTFGMILTTILISVTNLTITEPVDGETYDGDWLPLRAIVENENELPDSVHYSLNGAAVVLIPRLNTDWYTYMQNDLHNGFSESPAPIDNTILWTAPILGTLHEFPTPVVVDGLVYHPQDGASGGYGDTLFALDAATGEIEWIFTGTGPTDDAVTVKDGRLYIACDSVYCLDAYTGEMIWVFGDANGYGSTPAVSDGKVYCAQGTESLIYCLDAENGEEIWSSEVTGVTVSCMTVWQDMLFVPTFNNLLFEGLLFALDNSSGEIIWENGDPPGRYWDSSPNVVDGVIYIGGMDGYLRAIDAASGETIWLSSFGANITATPAYHSDAVFIGSDSNDGPFASVNALTGVFNWLQNIGIHGSPGIADGLVFFGEINADSAAVFALDCETGDEIWKYEIFGGIIGITSSPSITDGVVYIAATDGNLYAFGTGLKYTYNEDYFYADVGPNELIVTSFNGGTAVAADTINFTVTQTGITLEPSSRLSLCASPNPFYSTASISFELSEPGWTSVTVYDLSGRIVRTLENSELGTGQQSIVWDGRRENGEPISAGLYLCRIQSSGISETTGLCLLR